MGLNLVLAHQTLAQLPDLLRSTVLGNARSFVVFRCDRLDAELLARYVGDVDPGEIRDWDLGRGPIYEPLTNQWERAIGELAAMPLREAVLSTKGRSPRRFRTLDFLTDSERSQTHREELRRLGRENGWLRPCSDIDEELAVRSVRLSDDSGPSEPSDFWESARGSD